MKVYVGSDAFAKELNARYSCQLAGNLLSPQHWFKSGKTRKVQYAIDNGAWIAFKKEIEWQKETFLNILKLASLEEIKPDFIVCPDVVGNAIMTSKLWKKWYPILSEFEFKIAFALQDGHTLQDVPPQADLLFLGGTTQWKLKNISVFCPRFPTHVARVNSHNRLWLAHNNNAISIDGTGWSRKGYISKDNQCLHDYLNYKSGKPKTNSLFDSNLYVDTPTIHGKIVF